MYRLTSSKNKEKVRPYTVVQCFLRYVRPQGIEYLLALPMILLLVIYETVTLPIFPLIYKLHQWEHAHFGKEEI